MSSERPGDVTVRPDGTQVAQSAPAEVPERFQNPGLPAHRARLSDTDPRSAKRVERQLLALLALSVAGTIGTLVAYFAMPPGDTVDSMRTSNILLGLGLFLALFSLGVALIHWSKALMSDRELVEERHPQRQDDAVRAEAVAALKAGAEDSGLGRRSVLKGALVSAAALVPLTIAVPLVGEVGGDWNTRKFGHTLWKRGTRLAKDPSGDLIRPEDVTIGSAYHVIPDGLREGDHAAHWIEEKAKAVVLMVRMDPSELTEEPDRKGWSYEGIVAYSKICTHVGCPVALYERQTHHLLCPCHQSTFDMAHGARVVFGPASRPLPQLPIMVDEDGYLAAQHDFTEPIGPSYWERLGHAQDTEEAPAS